MIENLIIIPARAGSQRIPNKNITPFGDSNLLEMKLNILKEVPDIDEIIVNSDCDDMLAIGEKYGCSKIILTIYGSRSI